MMMKNENQIRCRGCQRFKLSGHGVFYQLRSEAGWSPAGLIINTDALNELLEERPRKEIKAPRTTPAFPAMVADHEIFEEHIDHVNHLLPVFIGEYTFTENATGRKEMFHLCPDGHHRIAKCLKLGIDVPLVLFTEAEMRACSHTSIKEYMATNGIFVFGGPSDEEIEKVLWEA